MNIKVEKRQKFDEKSRKPIDVKDIEKAFKGEIEKDGDSYVYSFGNTTLRNKDKKALMRDYFTLNGYLVKDGK